MPLLECDYCYWGKHTRTGITEKVEILALRVSIGWISIYLPNYYYCTIIRRSGPYLYSPREPTRPTVLPGVALRGIVKVDSTILEIRKWDVNVVHFIGSMDPGQATGRGREEVVNMLSEQGCANSDRANTQYGPTPLSWEAGNGHNGG